MYTELTDKAFDYGRVLGSAPFGTWTYIERIENLRANADAVALFRLDDVAEEAPRQHLASAALWLGMVSASIIETAETKASRNALRRTFHLGVLEP